MVKWKKINFRGMMVVKIFGLSVLISFQAAKH